jgi:hypothetical protein
MEASQHSLLAARFTLHSINATLAIVPQRGAGLWMTLEEYTILVQAILLENVTQRGGDANSAIYFSVPSWVTDEPV